MVKFKGNGAVWDPDKVRILCRFVKGEFETGDQYIIDKLIARGYESDAPIEEPKPTELDILKAKAFDLGIEVKGNWGVKRITEAIEEKETDPGDIEE